MINFRLADSERIMRTMLALLGPLMVVSSAQGATLWNEQVGQWAVGSYSTDQSTNFSHCAAGYVGTGGILLMFSISANYSWGMGLQNKNWRLKPGNQYSVRYWVDTNDAEYGMAIATSSDQVLIPLKDNVSLFNNFQRGNTLFLSAQNSDFSFSLKDSSRMLTYLLECVKAGGLKPPIVATSPNPFGPPVAASTDRTTLNNAKLAAERAEATVLAANLISQLGISGFTILRPDEMPEGWKPDAMWRSDSGIGTVTVLPSASDSGEISPAIIAQDAKGCKKAFASGSLPAESSSPITRLFTRCGTGKDAFVGFYVLIPRQAGGQYVIGTFSIGEEEAAKALDSGIRQAIFRALPNNDNPARR
jgi:hypothetical protein